MKKASKLTATAPKPSATKKPPIKAPVLKKATDRASNLGKWLHPSKNPAK